jgi:hypothetical protein
MSNGLAWFARQIPSEGQSDLNQGRVGEKEIPHSDQWIHPEDDKGREYRPDKFNRKQVLKGSNRSAGVSRMLIEEIYQSQEYRVNRDPHNATYENGRYVFAYPAPWQNSRSVNKMVAVRRIDTKPRDYLLDFKLGIELKTDMVYHDFQLQIPSEYSIQEILSTMKLETEQLFKPDTVAQMFSAELTYKEFNVTIVFKVSTGGSYIERKWTMTLNNNDFMELFNLEPKAKAELTAAKTRYEMKDVRPRKAQDVFLHASFVTNSTSGYLGRDGEFYEKPSKVYPDDGQSFFFIETSLDGYTRTPLPYENFIVELIFIIDSENYMGE